MMRARGCAAALVALTLVAAAGCGGGGDRAEGPGAKIAAGPGTPGSAAVAAKPESGAPPAAGVATVNGVVISEAKFAEALRDAAFSAKPATLEGRRWVLDRVIDRELALQQAFASGAERLPAVQRAGDRIRRRDLMSQLSRQIAAKAGGIDAAAIDTAVGPLPKVLEATVMLVDDGALAGDLVRRIRAGEDFTALGAQHAESVGPERVVRRQFVTRSGSTMYPPDVEAKLFALAEGEVASLATPVGNLVARVEIKRDLTAAEVADARTTTAQKLIATGLQQAQVELLEKTRQKYPVKRFIESFADQPAMGKDRLAGWRTFQETRFATVGPLTLMLDELYRNPADYDLMARSGKDSQRAAFDDLSERVISSALYAFAAGDQGLKPSAQAEQRVARELTGEILQAFTNDLILVVKRDELGRQTCQGLFEKAPARYLPEERLNFRQILVRRENDAQQVLARLRAGEDFAKLARELSADVSAEQGGDMGWRTRRELEALFSKPGAEDLLQRAKSGLSGIVTLRTTKGYHLLALGGYRRPGEGHYEEAEERILDDCLDEQRREVIAKLAKQWREKATISVDDAKLASIMPLPGLPADDVHKRGVGGTPAAPPSHGGGGQHH